MLPYSRHTLSNPIDAASCSVHGRLWPNADQRAAAELAPPGHDVVRPYTDCTHAASQAPDGLVGIRKDSPTDFLSRPLIERGKWLLSSLSKDDQLVVSRTLKVDSIGSLPRVNSRYCVKDFPFAGISDVHSIEESLCD